MSGDLLVGRACRRCAARAGFTMIEIMCVVVIMAIAAAIVFAGISTQKDLNGESAARTVMSDILYAQSRAIATQSNVYITFNITGTTPTGGLPAASYALCNALPITYLTNPVTHASYTSCWTNQNWSVSSVNFGGQSAMYFDALGTPHSCDANGGTVSLFGAPGTLVVTGGSNPPQQINIQADTGDVTVQ